MVVGSGDEVDAAQCENLCIRSRSAKIELLRGIHLGIGKGALQIADGEFIVFKILHRVLERISVITVHAPGIRVFRLVTEHLVGGQSLVSDDGDGEELRRRLRSGGRSGGRCRGRRGRDRHLCCGYTGGGDSGACRRFHSAGGRLGDTGRCGICNGSLRLLCPQNHNACKQNGEKNKEEHLNQLFHERTPIIIMNGSIIAYSRMENKINQRKNSAGNETRQRMFHIEEQSGA